ncbi:MAG TPA: hypothetical protein VI685_19400 [Candidatus Angelobacter sp.]
MKEDLYSLRNAIDQFRQDEGFAPANLDDLVAHGYLREIPRDPFTNSATTWQLIYENFRSGPQDTPAVAPPEIAKPKNLVDVRSGSNQIGSDGTHYSDW